MFDIRRFAKQHSLAYLESGHHHCHAGWIQLHCQFCAGGLNGYHLGFNLTSSYFNCWRCGGHSIWKFVKAVLRTSRSDLVKKILSEFETDVNHVRKIKPKVRKRSLKPPPGLGPLATVHKQYLKNRRYQPKKLAEIWGLKGTRHLSGDWNWRVVFPICDKTGYIVAYSGRAVSKIVKPKYRVTDDEDCLANPKGFLYGIHQVPKETVVIVEGAADVWRLGPGAVATLGIDWNTDQANVLRRFGHRIVLYDPESQAQRQAQKLAEWLSFYPGETEIIDKISCDPGALKPEKARRLMVSLGF